jgi:predicted NAD/FAD-dependent oxidoreductase
MDENIKKDKKKKSPSRKRDRLWKFIFPQDNKETIGSEQQSKIDSLSKFAQQNISVVVEESIFQTALERNDWDLKKAMVDLLDFEEATHGILIEPPSPYATLMGSENDGGTSCYIDSLLFAMFISITAFDPLLTYDIPSEEEEDNNAKIQLQNLVRLFVNKMRKGGLIKADFVHWLRQILQEAHWTGQDSKGNWSQEDASELFMFLTEAFDLPYLPVSFFFFFGREELDKWEGFGLFSSKVAYFLF